MTTIKDVAKEANVAISTVSNVLTGRKNVSPDVRRRVEDAVRKLNYSADYTARSMKNKHTMKIGFVALDLCGLFFPYVLQQAYRIARQHGYSLAIADSNMNFEEEKKNMEEMVMRQMDGIIFSSTVREDLMEDYAGYLHDLVQRSGKKIHLISIERDFSPWGIDSVCTDFYSGACAAVSHLINAGCRQIAHIAAPEGNGDIRCHAYEDTLRKNGLPVYKRLIKRGDLSHISGYNAAGKLLRQKQGFDSIFVANDQMAIGVLQCLREHSIRVPEDIRVVGFDDVFVNQSLNPTLTSVHVQKRALGSHAMETLIGRIEGGGPPEVHYEMLKTHLIIRGSTDKSFDEKNIRDHINW